MSGNIYNQLAVANLADGRLQLWTVDENLALFSRQQQTTDPNSGWTPLTSFQTPQAKAVTFAVAPLSDGRLQLFIIDGSYPGQIWSTWQETTESNSAWTSLSPFQAPEKGAYSVTAAPLNDGRLQLFVSDSYSPGTIWSTRQQTTDPNSGWTPLTSFQTLQTGARFLAVGSLSDRRLQLFLMDNTWQMWSTQEQTAQRDAPWAPLSPLPTFEGGRRALAAAPLSDGRLQFFVGDGFGQGQIWTTRQQTTAPHSGWTPFSQLS
jgi:hypothetical protein